MGFLGFLDPSPIRPKIELCEIEKDISMKKGSLPHLVIHTNNLKSGRMGRANGPIIYIRSAFKNDEAVYRHEYEHVKQWYMTLGTLGLWYKFIRRFRLWSEAQAFAAKVRHGDNLNQMAHWLSGDSYDLKISRGTAARHIRKYI